MFCGFQTNGFQNNAFQIGRSAGTAARDTHDGITRKHKIHLPVYGKTKETLGNIQFIYDKARQLPRKETKELRDAVSAFVEPAVAMQAVVPEIEKIDYAALEANQAAYDKFLATMDNLQKNIALAEKITDEDSELFLLAIICCTIQ